MEKRIILDGKESPFWIEDSGRLRNEKTKRWLKGGINKGYHFYSLYFKGKQYILYTHRIVAEYFIPNPDNLPIVHHIDGNKINNIYTNLQWVSTKDHQKTIEEQKKQNEREKKPRIYIQNLDSYGEIAQFRNSPYYATKDGKILNMSKKTEVRLEKSGNYFRFTGYYNLGKKHFLVHRVIWEAFNGEILDGYDIDHIDGNPKNNSLNNLQMITHKENIKKREKDWSYVSQNFNKNR